MTPEKRLSGNAGFSLLEMMVAVAILSLGIAGALRAMSTGMMAVKASETYSQAALLGHRTAAELERTPDLAAGELSGEFEDEPGYTWEAQISESAVEGLLQARIRIIWQTGGQDRFFDMIACLRPADNASSAEGAR